MIQSLNGAGSFSLNGFLANSNKESLDRFRFALGFFEPDLLAAIIIPSP